jgi:catecholate siderophore receptor
MKSSSFAPCGARMRALAAGVSLAVLAASGALAQDAAPESVGTVRVGGEGETFTLQPSKDVGYNATRALSATKTETPLVDTPQAISIITQQQIEDQGIRGMDDAVRYVPGVTFAQGENNRDNPVFRGNSTSSDFYVDGVRDDVEYFRDIYNIDRVEVLKGPNAMIFGRGAAGGLINRVTKQADWDVNRQIHLEAGSYDNYRATFDVGQGVTDAFAVRLTGVWQDADSFRDGASFERWGLNPTASFKLGTDTLITAGYERYHDERTADRGIPSFNGRPLAVDPSTFFGDPTLSPTYSDLDAFSVSIEHHFSDTLILRNRTRYTDQNKFYQNFSAGAVNGAKTAYAVSGYNNRMDRTNLFNQTDLTAYFNTGQIKHTLLLGAEFGRQETDNFRNTAYFTAVSPTTTSINIPLSAPTFSVPVTFRQSATDANNHGVAKIAAAYIQDQIELTPNLQAVLGLRYDSFRVDFTNNRTGANFKTDDGLWSPRVGLIYKPAANASLYASYSVAYVPRAGQQLSSLSVSNESLKPEKFINYEIGAKWDVTSNLSLGAAIFQLDRTNVLVPDPSDPTLSILVDGQRVRGVELSATGQITDKWSAIAAYTYQDGEITRDQSATVQAGATLANIPEHAISLWNRYDVTDRLGLGLGVIYQGKRYAALDNLVQLPSFTRVDAAVFFAVTDKVGVQLNVENLFDEGYIINSNSNNNLSPGSPRAFRVGLNAKF